MQAISRVRLLFYYWEYIDPQQSSGGWIGLVNQKRCLRNAHSLNIMLTLVGQQTFQSPATLDFPNEILLRCGELQLSYIAKKMYLSYRLSYGATFSGHYCCWQEALRLYLNLVIAVHFTLQSISTYNICRFCETDTSFGITLLYL